MAVRIEGAALVVRRDRLDRSWPGGADGLLEEFEDDWPWLVDSDEQLVAISVDDIRFNECLLDMFAEHGILGRLGITWLHLAIVDEEWGPIGRCDWLEFVQVEEEGRAWMTPRLER